MSPRPKCYVCGVADAQGLCNCPATPAAPHMSGHEKQRGACICGAKWPCVAAALAAKALADW